MDLAKIPYCTKIGPISRLARVIRVSHIVSFPSTLFLTFAGRFPKNSLEIIDLPRSSSSLSSYNKIHKMKLISLKLIDDINYA